MKAARRHRARPASSHRTVCQLLTDLQMSLCRGEVVAAAVYAFRSPLRDGLAANFFFWITPLLFFCFFFNTSIIHHSAFQDTTSEANWVP